MRGTRAWVCGAVLLVACQGGFGEEPWRPGSDGPRVNAPPSPSHQEKASALRRLSRREIGQVLVDVLAWPGDAATYLPVDVIEPFDTDAASKTPSMVFITGLEALAFEVARDVAATPRPTELAGCTPSDASDEDCYAQMARELGLRLWRRPLTDAEVTPLAAGATSIATEASDVGFGTRFVIQSLLQSPRFPYQTSIGESDEDDLMRLDNHELVSRLSFMIWGTAPDDTLLAAAEGDSFSDDELMALARTMLEDPRGQQQITAFHEMWLGFRGLRVPDPVVEPMLAETDALLARTLFEDDARRWTELFTSTSTFVDPVLAAHYGMPEVTEPTWVEYTHAQRAGVLSHGSVLSLSAENGNDTSITIRGAFVATRLLCREIPEPPANVNVDDKPEPGPDECKIDVFREAHSIPGTACHSCHQLMDPIGFGLERFDGYGVYREVEERNPSCNIDGEGELHDVGPFNGPRELAGLMVDSGELTRCGVEQFVRFSTGRELTEQDAPTVYRVHEAFMESGERFDALVLAFVGHPSFRYRREEAQEESP